MIPKDYITEWRREAPWVEDFQVEQDLVISRALVELFSHQSIKDALAFRGGTALYKLFLRPAARYSEDIDLVQRVPGAIGSVFDAIKDVLNPWLGEPKRDQKQWEVDTMRAGQSSERQVLRGNSPDPVADLRTYVTEFRAFIEAEVTKWGEVAQRAGIRPE